MPSASTKSDVKPPVDPTEGVKQILSIVDKKIRNLEKRKGKLDQIREKKKNGADLNPDQVEAISRYDQVLQNLELSREFQKQFTDTLTATEKLWKKQQKREKIERQQEEQKRVQELLMVQNVLDSMGGEQAREDFSKGQHGAVQLSEDNLNQLDELYKLISPTRENEEVSFQEQIVTSSEHFCNLLDGKEKDVIGTTYKDLKDVVGKIVESGYLDRPAGAEEEPEETVEEVKEEVVPPADEEEVNTEVTENGQIEEVPGSDEFGATEQPETVVEPEPTELPTPTLHTEVLAPEVQPDDQLEPTLGGGNTESEVVDDAFFSTAFHNKQRPFNEIVSSVQGNFNFLQDSEIDLESSGSPHMDPAVVAAHPMPQALPHHQTESSLTQGLTSQTYQSSTFVTSDEQTDSQQQQSSQPTSHVTPQTGAPSLVNQSELDNTYSQNYTGHMSHSLQDSTLHSIVNPSSELTSHVSQSTAPVGQTTHVPNTEPSALPPQPIPMPNQTSLGQTSSQDLQPNQEKKFSMNANAAVFHSIYSQPTGSTYQTATTTTADSSSQEEKDNNTQQGQQNDYQSGYNSYGRMNNRGGRGGRGGSGGQRGGMSNGYNSRGGSGNNRGGAPFNNRNNMGSSGFNNGSRGGNNRAMRGGGPPRGNTWRGGRGGNGKPNMGYQSQGQGQVQANMA